MTLSACPQKTYLDMDGNLSPTPPFDSLQQAKCRIHEHRDITVTSPSDNELSEQFGSSSVADVSEIMTYSTDNFASELDSSPDSVTKHHESMPWRQNVNNDSVLTPDKMLLLTPELPAVESSQLLDIPFASLFDVTDFDPSVTGTTSKDITNENTNESTATIAPKSPQSSNPPGSLDDARKHMPVTDTDSVARCSQFRRTTHVNSSVKPGVCSSSRVDLPEVMLHEQEVCLTNSPMAKCRKDASNGSEENNNSHLEDPGADNQLDNDTEIGAYDNCLQGNSSISMADIELNKLAINSPASTRTKKIKPSLLVTSPSYQTESNFMFSGYAEALQQINDRKLHLPSAPSAGNNDAHIARLSDTNRVLPPDCATAEEPMSPSFNHTVSRTDLGVPCRDTTWSYHILPDVLLNTTNSEGDRDGGGYITVRTKLQRKAPTPLQDAETGSASKRRKDNNGTVFTANENKQIESVRQKLSFTNILTTKYDDENDENDHDNNYEENDNNDDGDHDTTGSHVSNIKDLALSSAKCLPYEIHIRNCKSTVNSPRPLRYQDLPRKPLTDQDFPRKPPKKPTQAQKSQRQPGYQQRPLMDQGYRRKPLENLDTDIHNNRYVAAESASCLPMSTDNDSNNSEMSRSTSLPSHTEYTFGSDGYAFKEAKRYTNTGFLQSDVHASRPYKQHCTFRDPATNEILERYVEGAENVVPGLVIPRKRHPFRLSMDVTSADKQNVRYKDHASKVNKQTKDMINVSQRKKSVSNRSSTLSKRYRKLTLEDSRRSSRQFRRVKLSSNRRRSTVEPSRSTKSKTPNYTSRITHPVACSTMIVDYSPSKTANDTESVSSWAVNDDSSVCNIRKPNRCKPQDNRERVISHSKKLHEAGMPLGKRTSKYSAGDELNGKAFEISPMVLQIDKDRNRRVLMSRLALENKVTAMHFNKNSSLEFHTLTSDVPSDYHFSTTQSETVMSSNDSGDIQSMDTQERSSLYSVNEQATPSSLLLNQATVSIPSASFEESSTPEASDWLPECPHPGLRLTYLPQPHCRNDDRDHFGDLVTTAMLATPGNCNTPDDDLCSAARCRPRQPKQTAGKQQPSEYSIGPRQLNQPTNMGQPSELSNQSRQPHQPAEKRQPPEYCSRPRQPNQPTNRGQPSEYSNRPRQAIQPTNRGQPSEYNSRHRQLNPPTGIRQPSEYSSGQRQPNHSPDRGLPSEDSNQLRQPSQPTEKRQPPQYNSQHRQSVLSSIRSDSFQSVNPRGILAPYNSMSGICNDKWEHFYNGESLYTLRYVSPVVHINEIMKPKASNLPAYHVNSAGEIPNADSVAICEGKVAKGGDYYHHQYTLRPHANPVKIPGFLLTQQSQPASSAASTSGKSTSVSMDQHDNEPIIALSSAVVTQPPKVKRKFSIVHKLRKFRNKLYRKTKTCPFVSSNVSLSYLTK